MADNSTYKDASGASQIVGSDERTIASVAVKVQRMVDQGATARADDDVSVTTTAAQVVAARETRKDVVLLADPANTSDIYIGASGVDAATPANGFLLKPGATKTEDFQGAIYADAVAGTQRLFYTEVYDS